MPSPNVLQSIVKLLRLVKVSPPFDWIILPVVAFKVFELVAAAMAVVIAVSVTRVVKGLSAEKYQPIISFSESMVFPRDTKSEVAGPQVSIAVFVFTPASIAVPASSEIVRVTLTLQGTSFKAFDSATQNSYTPGILLPNNAAGGE